MANEQIPAVYGLNKYLWQKIQDEALLGDNYGGLIPIIPVQQEPLLQQQMDKVAGISTYPYIVYTWYKNGGGVDWFIQEDQIIYTIYAPDLTALNKLMLLIVSHFKRVDDSALAVNRFIQTSYPLPEDVAPEDDSPAVAGYEYRAYIYKDISVRAAQGGGPTTGENEPLRATVTVQACYTNTYNDIPLQ